MDRRAKVNLREEEAGGTDADLREGAGHVRQQVRREDTGLDPAVTCVYYIKHAFENRKGQGFP